MEGSSINTKTLDGLHGLCSRDVKLYIRDILDTDQPKEFQDFSDNGKKEWLYEKTREKFPSMPESLVNLTVGFLFAGDCGRPQDERPDWLDMDIFEKGQEFIKRNLFGLMQNNGLSFFLVFSFPEILDPLIMTKKSSTPFTSFKRYLSTASRFMIWFTGDIWTKGSPANAEILLVRKIHLNIREKLLTTPTDTLKKEATIVNPWSPTHQMLVRDFQESCPTSIPNECPFSAIGKKSSDKLKGMSQSEMAMTQFAFVGLIVLYPAHFGISATDGDGLYAYCYVWRSIGYLLGIDDEYNLCRGTLKEIRARCKDYVEFWVKPNLRNVTPEWEHMMRCMIEGLGYYGTSTSYETMMLLAMQMIYVRIPRFESKLSMSDRLSCKLFRITYYLIGTIPGLSYILSKLVTWGMKKAQKLSPEKHRELWRRSAMTWKFPSELANS